MTSQHERIVNRALDTGEEIRNLFDQLGSAAAKDGSVLAAYRSAIRLLDRTIDDPESVEDVLRILRSVVLLAVDDTLKRATTLGAQQAERDLSAWNVSGIAVAPTNTDAALGVVIAKLDAQLASVRAQMALGRVDADEILGDDSRVGILRPTDVLLAAGVWVTTMVADSYEQTVDATIATDEKDRWGRQAVSAIDERTTDCCLQVNGQVVGLDEDYELTGEPRFADHLHAPPFHWNCRTATALVLLSEQDDALTGAMREAGRAEVAARRDGSRQEIHPANATSGRG